MRIGMQTHYLFTLVHPTCQLIVSFIQIQHMGMKTKWHLWQVDLLSRLHSPYLVELLGYCADQHHRLLIFEYMPNGTLQHHLHSPNDQTQPLDWWARMRIALDCARALEFLHEHAVSPVIHRDFKSNNVLLDQNFRAKVADFGLAKMGSEKRNGQVSTRVLGTTGYLAPEWVIWVNHFILHLALSSPTPIT